MLILYSICGLVLLILGADFLVKYCSNIASALKIPPLVIGLTIVAFGTSAPELAVGIKSSLDGSSSMVMGNVVGSNIFNVLFILGVAALISPLVVTQQLVKFDTPLMVVLSIAVFLLAMDHKVSQIEGIVLVAVLITYILFLLKQARKMKEEKTEDESEVQFHWVKNITLTLVGLGLLVFGSELFIDNLVKVARSLNVSEEIIGLTLVAAGTSLPELVTSIMAVIKGQVDIAVGNVVGSNIFNLLGVLGLSCAVNSNGCDVTAAMVSFDIPLMIAVSVACLPIFFTGNRINRVEGALFMSVYIAYTTYLILLSSHHDSLKYFTTTLLYFFLPLVTLGISISVFREIKSRKSNSV